MLKKELESTTEWFKDNSMTSNLDKFPAIILHKDTTDVTHKLRIYDNEIETTKSVKLLWVQFDNQIKFKNLWIYVLKRQCNWTLSINCKGIWVKLKKNAIINNFIYSNFSYCP